MLRSAAAISFFALAAAGGDRPPRTATFDVRHEVQVTVPQGAKLVRLWVALPQDDPAQRVADFAVESAYVARETRDDHGNRMLYVEAANPEPGTFAVVTRFRLTRAEVRVSVDAARARPLTERERAELAAHLKPTTHVVVDDRIRALAAEIVGSESNPVNAARAIYDWTLRNIDYWVKDPATKKASPVGSTEYCLATKTGNCTDFHSLYMSLAIAAGIPTRIIYGSFLKAELDGKETDQSYHCWLDVYAGGMGWIPLDVAVADIFVGDFVLDEENATKVRLTTADGYSGPDPAKVDYYFGNLEERRVTWSVGRDLMLDPRQSGGPVNMMAKAYCEIDGVVQSEGKGWKRTLTFRQVR